MAFTDDQQNNCSDGSYAHVSGHGHNNFSYGSYTHVFGDPHNDCSNGSYALVSGGGVDNSSNGSYAHVSGYSETAKTNLEPQAILHKEEGHSETAKTYLEPQAILHKEEGQLGTANHLQAQVILRNVESAKYKHLKKSNFRMKICILVLVGLFLATICVFLLTWFHILNVQAPSDLHTMIRTNGFDCPLKYNLSVGGNYTISCIFPTLSNYTSLAVDLHRTRVRNQDERLVEVSNISRWDNEKIESGRISAMVLGSDGSITITIKIQSTHCHDHGYIAINVSGALFLYVEVEVTAATATCPQIAMFRWNATQLVSCSACVGSALPTVTWYREVNGSHAPVSFNNDPIVLTPGSFKNVQEERIVSMMNFSFGIIYLSLVNRCVYCSDGGIYGVSLYLEHMVQNLTINIIVNGFLESCPAMWDINLTGNSRKSCNICIGETKDMANISITQEGFNVFKSALLNLRQRESMETKFKDFLTLTTSLDAGMINVLFQWSRVQCIDAGYYRVEASIENGSIQRNITVYIEEPASLNMPKIIQGNGIKGGFAEGFNLSLTCSVEHMGCMKHEIHLSLPDRNTTFECRNLSLKNDNINDSYTCFLKWTEFNISSSLNGTHFYCGYNYTNRNGTVSKFRKDMTIFVIPSNFCEGSVFDEMGCFLPHPLGGTFFINCDSRPPYRPWEEHCDGPLVFTPGTICNGRCLYSSNVTSLP